jgi:hypothetical protein
VPCVECRVHSSVCWIVMCTACYVVVCAVCRTPAIYEDTATFYSGEDTLFSGHTALHSGQGALISGYANVFSDVTECCRGSVALYFGLAALVLEHPLSNIQHY